MQQQATRSDDDRDCAPLCSGEHERARARVAFTLAIVVVVADSNDHNCNQLADDASRRCHRRPSSAPLARLLTSLASLISVYPRFARDFAHIERLRARDAQRARALAYTRRHRQSPFRVVSARDATHRTQLARRQRQSPQSPPPHSPPPRQWRSVRTQTLIARAQ